MSAFVKSSAEPIPGYVLIERIGAGGFGEVWKAEAPGGLHKAVKLTYGFIKDQRASQELKSLNRIKGVRHPFLLSLERIEVVDDQLVIVTELADMSLRDRFHQCREAIQPGVPREELLGYMQDAADGLDYMREHHSLQHLDVKPENLLLLSGRIKVADFGVVKDLHDATVSLMGGVTPLYAAPEVFDGRASLQSDQYSLAIVYQEMLTGVLPFAGRTPAQLAAQHLKNEPNLSVLSPSDQAAVRRAMSKSPDARFASCSDFVKQLRAANAAPVSFAPLPENQGALGTFRDTMCLGGAALSPRQERHSTPPTGGHSAPPLFVCENRPAAPPTLGEALPAAIEAEATTLPPLALAGEAAALRPTLVVGVGGMAGRSLAQLRRKLQSQFGDLAALGVIRTLAIDTDAAFLETLVTDDPAVGDARSILPLPLRSTLEYRERGERFSAWLSRRWIYNVPRAEHGMNPMLGLLFPRN